MSPAPHPFDDVARLDAARGGGLQLLRDGDAGAVRLRDDAAMLWILLRRENGSIWDRWSDSDGYNFVFVEDATAAQGSAAILAQIDAARRATPESRPSGFQILKGHDGGKK